MNEKAVAQIIHRYGGGGAQRVTLTLARGLKQAGVRSLALSMIEAGEYAESVSDEIEVVDLRSGVGGLAGAALACTRLMSFLRGNRIDLVHSHNRGSLLAFLVATLGWKRKPRLWFTWHIPDLVLAEKGLRRMALKWALRRCEAIWGDSQDIIDRLVAQLPEVDDRSRVFINAVPERPETKGQALEMPVLLWLARVARTKDPEIILRAAARLRDEGHQFRVIIAGSAIEAHVPYEKRMHALWAELDLEDIVEWRGWVDDVDSLLDEVNVGVQTSHFEGLSLTLLEQMMAGLAMVATDVGDTRVAILDGDTGSLIPAKDLDVLSDALRELIVDPEHRRRRGEAARDIALREFSMTAMTRRALRDLELLAGSGAGGR